MEIAVASNSALGQYLAEIDAEVQQPRGDVTTTLLKTRTKCDGAGDSVSEGSNWLQLFKMLRRRMETIALHRLISELSALHPTFREELQQVADLIPDVFSASSKSSGKISTIQVLQGVDFVSVGINGISFLLILSAMVATSGFLVAVPYNGQVAVLQGMKVVASVTVCVLLSLELSFKFWLARYARRTQQVMRLLKTFIVTLEKFHEMYATSLTLVKRAELASRGYRLGAGFLPPIGRLEANYVEITNTCSMEEHTATSAIQTQLRCLPLRRKLRMLNEKLQIQASLLESEHSRSDKFRCCVEEKASVDDDAPSLLLTVLTKQHDRGVLLLEHTVRSMLIRKLACACSSRSDADGDLFRTLGTQKLALEHVNDTLRTWMGDLEVWNTTGDPMMLLGSVPDIKSSNRQPVKHFASVITTDSRLKGIALQLQELRSTSETLVALLVAAQHDLSSAESAAGRLTVSRDMMRSMVQQLQETWDKYDRAVNALADTQIDTPEDVRGEAAVEDYGDHKLQVPTTLALPSVSRLEDPDCTVVFTGTSTGDEGFDLEALTKQHELDAATTISDPTPVFISELRNVLAHREAHASPQVTKEVDHDPPIHKAPSAEVWLPAAAPIFALPRAPPRGQHRQPPSHGNELRTESITSAVQSELQALLQRSQPPSPDDDVFTWLNESDEKDDGCMKKRE